MKHFPENFFFEDIHFLIREWGKYNMRIFNYFISCFALCRKTRSKYFDYSKIVRQFFGKTFP